MTDPKKHFKVDRKNLKPEDEEVLRQRGKITSSNGDSLIVEADKLPKNIKGNKVHEMNE